MLLDVALEAPLAERARPFAPPAPEWIGVAPDAPYFVTESGQPWHPIGHNDAITWPELAPLFRRRDPVRVERHLRWLRANGVTCLRLMLEYAQTNRRFLEKPAGRFAPRVVEFWDDLFAMCERVGLHILLTPMDTFFQWVRWQHHPWNARHGGPCASRARLMVCPATRVAIKARLEFATRRWGGSPALFAWDLWNEMHPAQGDNLPHAFHDYIDDVGPWLRALETRLHGRAHLQTVSIFGPELGWKPWLNAPIFRHPALDFANTHLYEEGTIDDPADTVAPAVAVGRLIAEACGQAPPNRPVFDSEHGPIHSFKDHRRTLAAPFDDEYFRHIQWAHLASGGAGGGMRWPNRTPHMLTPGMRAEQRRLADFLPLVDWPRFARRPLTGTLNAAGCAVFACASETQAVLYLLRTGPLAPDGRLDAGAPPIAPTLTLPGLQPGRYRITPYAPRDGRALAPLEAATSSTGLTLAPPPFVTDLALAVARL